MTVDLLEGVSGGLLAFLVEVVDWLAIGRVDEGGVAVDLAGLLVTMFVAAVVWVVWTLHGILGGGRRVTGDTPMGLLALLLAFIIGVVVCFIRAGLE